jgi:hypothetical protein
MNRSFSSAALPGFVGSVACLLAACSAKSDVSLTGNTPSQYSHVWITVQEVDFSNDATAGSGGHWAKFQLSSPVTVDLVAQNGGNLADITGSLRVQPGTYSQVRLIPLDATSPLTTSAQNAGALYNSEADYVDSSGNTHQLPLEMLNPEGGLGIVTSLKVPFGNVGAALKGSGIANSANTPQTFTPSTPTQGTFASSADVTPNSTGLGIGSFASASSQTPNNSFVVFSDGTSDLVPFNYGAASTQCIVGGGTQAVPCVGMVLSQHATAYDVSQSAGISGQLTLTNITTATSGLPAIQVSAQQLSADGTRHVVVTSTAVQADGTFLLYPLASTTSSTGTFYDVVIHGPGIATIIIQNVQTVLGSCSNRSFSSSSSSNSNCSNSGTLGTTNTNGTGLLGSNTNTNTNTSAGTTGSTGTANTSANNVVAIGTLTPRAIPTTGGSYTATVSTAAAKPLPAGALVQFYQTIARTGEVPYVIETSTLDPFNQSLFTPQTLTTTTLDTGSWSSSGAGVTIVSAAPKEAAGTYLVAASAPSYGDGSLSPQVCATATSTCTGSSVVLPTLMLASGAAGTVSVTVTPATPGKYDNGQLMLSYNGTLVATASLNAVISSGGTVSVTGVPAQTPTSVYNATVRAWNSSDPNPASSADAAGTLQVQSYPTAIDLSGGTSGSIQLTVN